MREVSSGSSEKHSNPRPLSGVRMMLTVGARRTSMPLLRTSRPSAVVSSLTRSGSQLAPRATGQGSDVDGLAGSMRVPRTPAGPSDMTMGRKPMALSPCSAQESTPVSRRTFCSRLSRATRPDSLLRIVLAASSNGQDTAFSCIRMYGSCGSLGEGFIYGCDWLGHPVYLALLKTFQSAPYSRGASGTSVDMIFPSCCTTGSRAALSLGSVLSYFRSAASAAALDQPM